VIETDNFAIVFDYYKDTDEKYIQDYLLHQGKPIYVLVSHSHRDHFNREILDWITINKNVTYILSSDVMEEWEVDRLDVTCFLDKGALFEDKNLKIEAFGSTDIGISFLVAIGEKLIFHAGDLNNWHWIDESIQEEAEQAEKAYLNELDLLAERTTHLDLAMFPIDPRLGSQYMLGAKQFIEKINTYILAPMHFGRSYEKVAAFKPYAERYHCRFFNLTHKGQQIDI